MELTPLEKDVLDWFAHNADDPSLARQLAIAEVVERKYTGVGSFTELRVPSKLPRVRYRVCPVHPLIDSPDLEDGGSSVLFFEDGFVSTLELYAFGGGFPKTLAAWTLRTWPRQSSGCGGT